MWIARNLKRCMSICDIKRKLTNEYRPLIVQWACTRYRYVIYAPLHTSDSVAKSIHRINIFDTDTWKSFRNFAIILHALIMRWHAR